MKQFKQLLATNGNLNTNILVRAYLSNPDESPEYAVALIDALVNQVRDCQNELLNQARTATPERLKEFKKQTLGDWANKPVIDCEPAAKAIRNSFNRVDTSSLPGEDDD